MKKYSPLCALLLIILIFSASAKAQKDTIVTRYNYRKKPTRDNEVSYIGLKWKEGSIWKVNDFYWPENTIQMTGSYTEASEKVKHGLFRSFYKNGIEQDSCNYILGRKAGTQREWYESGDEKSVCHYNNGIMVDTCVRWHQNGKMQSIYIADSTGTGIEELYSEEGKIKSKGRYFLGKKNALWQYKDNGGVMSQEVLYEADSAVTVTCYDEKGNLETKADCVLEKAASFKGGLDGWRRYLERNLTYPTESQRNGVQGTVVVQFTVDKTGRPLDIKIINSPDKNLGMEAIRIIRDSPKWEPAIQYNRNVSYRLVQTVSFSL